MLSHWASVRLPWSCFQPPSLKFRTMGFPQYGFKHQSPRGSARSLPNADSRLSLIPAFPVIHSGWLLPSEPPRPMRSIRLNVRYAVSNGSNWAQRSSLLQGCVVPVIIAWRPHPPVWLPPAHFPALLVIESVFDIQGSSCLVTRPSVLSLPDFSGLPPSTSAGDPMCAYSHSFHTGNGHRVEDRNPWHHQPSASISFMRTWISTVRPFAFATALLIARPLG